jgi:hypothetical protein
MYATNLPAVPSTLDQTKALLRRSDSAVEAAIILLAADQTRTERARKDSHLHNSIGFNSFDATTGTRFAEWLSGYCFRRGRRVWEPKSLTNPKANRVFRRYVGPYKKWSNCIERARTIALKHAGQLDPVELVDLATIRKERFNLAS